MGERNKETEIDEGFFGDFSNTAPYPIANTLFEFIKMSWVQVIKNGLTGCMEIHKVRPSRYG